MPGFDDQRKQQDGWARRAATWSGVVLTGAFAGRIANETDAIGPDHWRIIDFADSVPWTTIEILALVVWLCVCLERLGHLSTNRYARRIRGLLLRECFIVFMVSAIGATRLPMRDEIWLTWSTAVAAVLFAAAVAGAVTLAAKDELTGFRLVPTWFERFDPGPLFDRRPKGWIGFIVATTVAAVITCTGAAGAVTVIEALPGGGRAPITVTFVGVTTTSTSVPTDTTLVSTTSTTAPEVDPATTSTTVPEVDISTTSRVPEMCPSPGRQCVQGS